MIILAICRATTADHANPYVAGAYYKSGDYGGAPLGPAQVHMHSDAPDYVCELERGVDETPAYTFPHQMKDGTVVNDPAEYQAYCLRYVPIP